jgi:hypothetical protein
MTSGLYKVTTERGEVFELVVINATDQELSGLLALSPRVGDRVHHVELLRVLNTNAPASFRVWREQ